MEGAPRIATVQAHTALTCLALGRDDFVRMLGPLQKLMEREKSPQVVAQRLSKLATFRRHHHGAAGGPGRAPAEVLLKRRRGGGGAGGVGGGQQQSEAWEVVRARGHLDEVQELTSGGSKLGERARGGAFMPRLCAFMARRLPSSALLSVCFFWLSAASSAPSLLVCSGRSHADLYI